MGRCLGLSVIISRQMSFLFVDVCSFHLLCLVFKEIFERCRVVMMPKYWPLICQYKSRDLNTGLLLAAG